jgi:hypothetical protein
MNFKQEKQNLTFRKLKISDYTKFKSLFYSCFKKEISFHFFKWRYFSDKFSFCYGVFASSKLIANVGMKMIYLNNNKNEHAFSRHSSMVLNQYRGKRIFSQLLLEVKKKYLKNISLIIMWPNANNFANFDIDKKKIIKKRYYLYKVTSYKDVIKKTSYYNINYLEMIKNFIQSNDSFLFKDYKYLKQRYLSYKNEEYLINKFELKNLTSFYILKKNKDRHGLNYVILDHFGSKILKKKHIDQLIKEKRKVILWSKIKIDKFNYELIDHINLNIGFFKNIDIKKKIFILSKEFMLGDTDSFITIK